MATIIVTAMILVAVTVWLRHAEALLVRWLDYQKPPEPLTVTESAGMPDDLVAYCRSFGSDWARQQQMEAMYELYGKLNDWQKVRTAVGISTGTI